MTFALKAQPSSLNLKLLRGLMRLWSQVLAILLVLGSGVAMLVMALGMEQSLRETRDAFYERYRFADVFAELNRAPKALLPRLADHPDIAVLEARILVSLSLDLPEFAEPATAFALSLPSSGRPQLNDLVLRSGRLPSPTQAQEILISEAFAEANSLRSGDPLIALVNGRKQRFSITGIVLSPEFIYAVSPGQIIPDDQRFGILWIPEKSLAAAFDLDGAFNSLAVKLVPGRGQEEVIAHLDRLLAPYGGGSAYGREDQISHAFLDGELQQLRASAFFIPPIFFLVALFLLNMILGRLIAAEREQIGVLKAFGYGNLALGWHYMQFGIIVAVGGILLGFLLGSWLGRLVAELYMQFFRFPFLYYELNPSLLVAISLVTLLIVALGTLRAVLRAALLTPAEAMQPPSPPLYQQGLMVKVFAKLPMTGRSRMTIRHLFGWPLRSLATVLGLAMALGLFITTLFFYDAVDFLMDLHFTQVERQDARLIFTEALASRALLELQSMPEVVAVEGQRVVPAKLIYQHRSQRGMLSGLAAESKLQRILDHNLKPFTLPKEGLVLSDKMAALLGVGLGARLRVEIEEGRKPVLNLEVIGIVREYIGTSAYIEKGALNRALGEAGLANMALVTLDEAKSAAFYRRMKETPKIAGVLLREVALRSFRDALAESMYIVVGFYVLFAAFNVIGVLYNAARITLAERGRELATLRVMGFSPDEVAGLLLKELALLIAFALPLGCLAGFGLSYLFARAIENDLFRVPHYLAPSTYGFSVLVVVVVAVLVGLVVRRQVHRLDLQVVLKAKE